MKNIIKQIITGVGLFAIAGCSDFLDQTSPSDLKQNDISESVYHTSLLVNQIYGGLTNDDTYSRAIPIIWSTNTDCELIDGLGTDAYNTSNERGNMNYNANPGWSDIADLWNNMYSIIEASNLAVSFIENSSLIHSGSSEQSAMERYKGEALTVRAMIYLDLIRFFGDIPFKTDVSDTDLSNAYKGKTDRDEIMDSLIVDLEEAITLLPWAGEVSGYSTERVTKGYAHALLANIALTRAGWAIREKSKDGYETHTTCSDPVYPTQRCGKEKRDEMYKLALKHLSAVITNSTHQLNPSFENLWTLLNQRQLDQTYRENLYEIPMGLGVSSELGYSIGVRVNGATTKYGTRGNSSGKQRLTSTLFWSYKDNDERRDITCSNLQIEQNSTGTMVESMLGNSPFQIYCGKWDIRKMPEDLVQVALSAGSAKWFTGINCVKMRYSQVLLMYAEVMNELAGGPDIRYAGDAGMTARQTLLKVHSRAFSRSNEEAERYVTSLPNNKEEFFEAIVDENAWEFAGEGVRKFDLIRWNLLTDKIKEFKQNYQNQIQNEYPRRILFNYSDETRTKIDLSSVTWKGYPAGVTDDNWSTYYDNRINSWGYERYTDNKRNSLEYLPSISSGLVGNSAPVINRYLMPIASTTISTLNGNIQNSYGYSN